ncbi:AAA family ATPase [Brevibacterium sp. FAM 27836]|uniref:AAA family ATPase n=1 Tax=Brevibacterium sp. FAM 27836 TaxID=3446693 RepID=UPI003F518D77
MSYFEEILETSLDPNQLRFSNNANSGGGQAFLAGQYIDSDGARKPLKQLQDREVTISVRCDISSHDSHDIRLNDPKCRYAIKPRGGNNPNMKFQVGGPGVDKASPSRAISAFFMLPPTTYADAAADLNLSILSTGNYWLATMPMSYRYNPEPNGNIIFETQALYFAGGVDKKKGGERRYFRLDAQRRIGDIIKLNTGQYFTDEINHILNDFARIYSNESEFDVVKCEGLTKQLMSATAKKYPELYSGITDPLPTLNYARQEADFVPPVQFRFVSGLASTYSRNIIWFGAPGTGKSFSLNERMIRLISDGGRHERVTFHQDYTYSNFVGTYKPVPIVDIHGSESISYRFVPGPFLRLLVAALANAATDDPKPHVLVIEEINRANASAVFGEVFQLLDRSSDGCSVYGVNPSEDVRQYLSTSLRLPVEALSELKIPDNMFIWASMNSADQGVYPLDTAFKRRWDFEYIGVNDFESALVGNLVSLGSGDYNRQVEWNDLRRAINDFLALQGINEDKQLGPYFIGNIWESDYCDGSSRNIFEAKFKTKVLMYLFEDAARSIRSKLFSGAEGSAFRYSDLCEKFDRVGIEIFNREIVDLVRSTGS